MSRPRVLVWKYGQGEEILDGSTTHPDERVLARLTSFATVMVSTPTLVGERELNGRVLLRKLPSLMWLRPLLQLSRFVAGVRFRPSIVVGMGSGHDLFTVALIARIRRSRMICCVMGDYIPRGILGHLSVVNRFHASLFTSDRVTAILTNNDAARARLIAAGIPASKTIRFKYELHENRVTRGSRDPSSFTIIFAGRFVREKGIFDLIRALREVLSTTQDTRVLLAGSGPLEMVLRRELKAWERHDRVTFLGWIPRNTLLGMYRSADLLVLPTYSEGLVLVVAESLSNGVPVVAYRTGGIPDLVRHEVNGLLVERGDVEGFVRAITRLHKDRGFLRKLSLNCHDTVRDYSSLGVPTFDSLLLSLIGDSPPAGGSKPSSVDSRSENAG